MNIIYIASPYTIGDPLDNAKRQIEASDHLWKNGIGSFLPLLSHFQEGISPRPYEEWFLLDKEMIKRCDAALRLSGTSKGADLEIAYAKEIGIPVFHDSEECIEHFRIEKFRNGGFDENPST
jgi:hypothetical protein